MRIPLVIILMLLSCIPLARAQKFTGEISYTKQLILPENALKELKQKNPQQYENFLNNISKAKDATGQIEFMLIFTEEKSNYYAENSLGKGDGIIESIIENTGLYYNYASTPYRYQEVEFQGKKFLIKREPLNWKLTGETKTLSGYSCRKATATQEFTSIRTKKTIIHNIEAWFTNEIPFPYGPEGFGGLPGLILEMKFAQNYYYATKIKLSQKNTKIATPNLKNVISFQEYQAIMEGLDKRFREFQGID